MFAERTTGFLFLLAIVAVSCFVAYRIAPESIPERWSTQQSVPNEYELRLDRKVFHVGKASLHMKSKVDKPEGFANLEQTLDAHEYRGRRLHLSAYIKTEIASGSVRLYLHVKRPGTVVPAHDDMHETPVTGITGWTRYGIILDVPRDAREISFGAIFAGNGQAWVDDFSIRTDDKEVLVDSFETLHGP